ncbi:DUF192 domain-containing protein [Sphingomonas sp.]|uniref:DUF192 domain-containing protein n=1 Tax=Sphingomonas sp. TaxID=28214 RepID=UPI0035C7BB1D
MRWLIASALLLAGCGGANEAAAPKSEATVTVASAAGARVFEVDLADTVPEQAQGLKFRTDIAPDGGMLFAPYPAEGGGPRAANFWMKDTPSPLDILFIRADGTIARIAENTVPFSEAPVPSEEPVAAVLEIRGGRAGELGIAEGDRVRWTVH